MMCETTTTPASAVESSVNTTDPATKEAESQNLLLVHANDDCNGAALPQHVVQKQSTDHGSYISLLQKNRAFRLFLSSFLVTHGGEWFTYVASISMIENIIVMGNNNSASSKTAVSTLVAVRLLPNVLFTVLGGALADTCDRRDSMVVLDVIGAGVALLYLVAWQMQSVLLVYVVAFAQQSIAALYEPCRSSIVPLMVTSDEDRKKAITLNGMAWSTMTALGAALGGFFVAWIGTEMCFVVDSCSYLGSAYLMCQVEGKYNVMSSSDKKYESVWDQIRGMTIDGARYIRGCSFGGLVFLKASAAMLFGASDVLNVSFSERGNPSHSSERLGVLFAVSGVGCIVANMLSDALVGVKPRPKVLQEACVWALLSITVGHIGNGFLSNFGLICLFSGIRAMGSSVLWTKSSLILQTFISQKMMGRILALDYALATLAHATSALGVGFLQDRRHLTPQWVSLVLSAMGLFLIFVWTVYHLGGRGVAGVIETPLSQTSDKIQGDQEAPVDVEATPLVDGSQSSSHPPEQVDKMPEKKYR